jgi:hypothetical protein
MVNGSGSEMTSPVVAMMEQGMRVMRAENDTQQSMAVARPRDEEKVEETCLRELEQYPQYAAKMYYVIPYKDRSDGVEKTVNVEGPSIKAANVLLRRWGNSAAGFRITGGDAENIQVAGVCLDYETNVRRTAELKVSRLAWNKKAGKMLPLRDDRLTMAIAAAGSKVERNAIFKILPFGLIERFTAKAKEIAASGRKNPKDAVVPIAQRMAKMYATFLSLGVDKKVVDGYLAEHHELESDEQVVGHMIGVFNAINDGEVPVEEVFSQFKKPAKAGAVSAAAPVITMEQRDELRKLREKAKVSVDTLREYLENQYGIDSTEKLPATEFESVSKWITSGEGEIPFGE